GDVCVIDLVVVEEAVARTANPGRRADRHHQHDGDRADLGRRRQLGLDSSPSRTADVSEDFERRVYRRTSPITAPAPSRSSVDGYGTPLAVFATMLSRTKLNPAVVSGKGVNVALMARNGKSVLKPMNPGPVTLKIALSPPTEKLMNPDLLSATTSAP